jgi:hypothetical protein
MTNLEFYLTRMTIIIVLALAMASPGCTVRETVYLQELHSRNAVSQPPIHLNVGDSAQYLYLSPRVTITSPRELTGDLEGSGPYKTTERNLRWTIPASSFALDLDWKLSPGLAISAGANYSNEKQKGLWGGNLGLGLLFNGEDIAGRLDGGIQLQGISYEAASVVVVETQPWFSSSTDQYVGYFLDVGRSSAINLYVSLTLNTKASQSPVNGYAQIAVGSQNFADFRPTHQQIIMPFVDLSYTDARVQSSSTYVMFSPGLYFSLSPTLRLLVGARLAWQLEVAKSSPGMLVIPTMQCDVAL